jgi:alkylation response protein AidB-like acyl-CoA dehydrogenase
MTTTETGPAAATASIPLPPFDLSDAGLARVTSELATTAEQFDRSAEFPWTGIDAVHRAGLLTAGTGQRYGGHELSAVDTVRLVQALGAGDPAVALISLQTIFQHIEQANSPWWPDNLYRSVLADSIDRPVLLNAINAEHELGAPARGGIPGTKIRRTDSGWVVNGHKGFATGSEGLAYHLVLVATEDDEPLVGNAIVPGDLPGVEVVKSWDHLGQRASSTHDVIYRDVEIPPENFVGRPLADFRRRFTSNPTAVLAIGALYVGVARSAQDFLVTFANERIPTSLGKPIAETEHIQSAVGEVEANIVTAEEVLHSVASRADAGDPEAAKRGAIAKLVVTRSAVAAVERAVAAIGNPGLTRHNPLERHLRDVLSSRVHPPQEDAALLIAGRAALARYSRQ